MHTSYLSPFVYFNICSEIGRVSRTGFASKYSVLHTDQDQLWMGSRRKSFKILQLLKIRTVQ